MDFPILPTSDSPEPNQRERDPILQSPCRSTLNQRQYAGFAQNATPVSHNKAGKGIVLVNEGITVSGVIIMVSEKIVVSGECGE